MKKSQCQMSALAIAMHVGILSSTLIMASIASNTTIAAVSEIRTYNIPAGNLSTVLNRFAAESDVQIVMNADQLQGIKSQGLQGRFNLAQGFQKILENSGYQIAQAGVGYVLIRDENSHQKNKNAAINTIQAEQNIVVSVQQSDEPVKLPIIEVTAQNESAKDWAYQQQRAVSVIDRSEIDNRSIRHVADILQATPGVYTNVDRTDPGVSINIRGMQDFGRVNMMIDGMRQNFVKSGHQQRNGQMYIDSEFINNIVVEKGPRADVHGATALAGSANFRTIDIDDVLMDGRNFGGRIRASTGLGDKYDGGIKFKGSLAFAGKFGQEEQLQLLYAHAYNKQGETHLGQRTDSYKFQPNTKEATPQLVYLKGTEMRQESNLFKARYNLSDIQSLQFSYIDTAYDYQNVSLTDYNAGTLWKTNGKDKIDTESYSVDYQYNPNDLVHLNAKLYTVKTKSKDYLFAPNTNGMGDIAWNTGLCNDYANVSNTLKPMCDSGLDNQQGLVQKTKGFQVDNTSIFNLVNPSHSIKANYGLEYFKDSTESQQDVGLRNGVIYSNANNNMNPKGERDVAGIFGTLNYDYGRFSAELGLRYDYYNLTGNTQIDKRDIVFQDREARFRQQYQNIYTEERILERLAAGAHLGPRFDPRWVATDLYQENMNIDKTWKKFLPSISGAINIIDGMDIFASWGKSWRPPAITETLIKGSHSGSSNRIYPNYMLEPEYSKHYEIGFNLNKQNLLTDGDQLNSKISWYKTRIDNFLVNTTNVGLNNNSTRLMSDALFVQNQIPMNYKGLEFDIRYDAQNWYSQLAYNHILSKVPVFCLADYPMGAGSQVQDLNYADGIGLSEEQYQALTKGHASYQAYLESLGRCDVFTAFSSAVNLPSSRGTLVLGTRLLDKKLDMGLRVNYSKAGGYLYTNGQYTDNSNGGWSNLISIEKDRSKQPLWPSYTLYDFYASYKVDNNLTLFGSVENIRDTLYVQNYGDILGSTSFGPGRTFIGGIELRF